LSTEIYPILSWLTAIGSSEIRLRKVISIGSRLLALSDSEAKLLLPTVIKQHGRRVRSQKRIFGVDSDEPEDCNMDEIPMNADYDDIAVRPSDSFVMSHYESLKLDT
jgi:hypothetical protein